MSSVWGAVVTLFIVLGLVPLYVICQCYTYSMGSVQTKIKNFRGKYGICSICGLEAVIQDVGSGDYFCVSCSKEEREKKKIVSGTRCLWHH